MIDKMNSDNAKYRNKRYVSELTVKIINYYSDPDKKARTASGKCKYCFYVNTSRVGGSAITTRTCDNCGKEMIFGNTCTEPLCLECAVETKHCKYCLQKID